MKNITKHIIASGGGGFGSNKNDLALERHILKLTDKAQPNICFLPQASKEDSSYIVRFYETFLQLGAIPSHVSLFGSVSNAWKEQLLNQDIIYVGGGNTKSMIALWQAWKVDETLQQAYEKGVILCGVSAGAICWFKEGVTDSTKPLGVVTGLGILPGSLCPHFDTEKKRPQAYQNYMKNNLITPGIALEDNTSAHFVDGRLFTILTTNKRKKSYTVTMDKQRPLSTTLIR